MWGAARHDRATGVHRPLVADVLVLAPLEPAPPEPAPPEPAPPEGPEHHGRLWCGPTSTWWGYPRPGTRPCAGRSPPAPGCPWKTPWSPTPTATPPGGSCPTAAPLPGGELIAPYLDDLATRLGDAARRAAGALRPATITYARGRCAMGANRDYWDAERGHFVCGTNPDTTADDTVVAARVAGPQGETVATLVNYACHPTTLAWENTLLSPDYPGAMRETVERATGAPCVFVLGACGRHRPPLRLYRRPPRRRPERARAGLRRPRGPGRAAPPRHRPALRRPGALRGHPGGLAGRPLLRLAPGPGRALRGGPLHGRSAPQAPPRPRRPAGGARRRGSAGREKRTPGAIPAPPATTGPGRSGPGAGSPAWRTSRPAPPTPCPTPCTASGTPSGWPAGASPTAPCRWSYGAASPTTAIVVSTLAGALQVAYLLAAERYGLGLYQEEPSILGPGCLEALTGAIAGRIAALSSPDPTRLCQRRPGPRPRPSR